MQAREGKAAWTRSTQRWSRTRTAWKRIHASAGVTVRKRGGTRGAETRHLCLCVDGSKNQLDQGDTGDMGF